MRCLISAVLAVVLSSSLQAQGETVIVTVDDLHGVCQPALLFFNKAVEERTPEEAVQLVRCIGYVEGVVSTVVRLSVAGFMTDPLYESSFCFPEATEPRNWVESFIGWTEANPEKRDTPAVDGFLLALIQAYPCGLTEGPTAPTDSS